MNRTIYADTDAGRLGATLTDNKASVLVWHANGPMIGYYKIERFEGGRLTPKTLRGLFTKEDAR